MRRTDPTVGVEDFFKYARERYRIHLRRQAGDPAPWTEDPVLREWSFCNVFREDDRTTQWFRNNIRNPLKNHPHVILATIAFRWFNRIETAEKIIDLFSPHIAWDSEAVRQRLTGVKPLVTGAYIIKTPNGMSKLDGVLKCIDKVHACLPCLTQDLEKATTLQRAHQFLLSFPYLGPFMAYEIVTDLRHTYLLEGATDIMEWAAPGPGCARGLGWVVEGDPDNFSYSCRTDRTLMLEHIRELLLCSTFESNWPRTWPTWEMREVEHTLCEYDKMCRAKRGQPLKRRYHAPV